MNNYLMGIPVLPIEGVPHFTPYKGSIQVAADCCGCVVWQGPAQQLHKAENPDCLIWCAMCLAKEMKYGGAEHSFIQLTNKGEGD